MLQLGTAVTVNENLMISVFFQRLSAEIVIMKVSCRLSWPASNGKLKKKREKKGKKHREAALDRDPSSVSFGKKGTFQQPSASML